MSAPNTIFENIYKLEPAQILEIDLSSKQMKNKLTKYWNPVITWNKILWG